MKADCMYEQELPRKKRGTGGASEGQRAVPLKLQQQSATQLGKSSSSAETLRATQTQRSRHAARMDASPHAR